MPTSGTSGPARIHEDGVATVRTPFPRADSTTTIALLATYGAQPHERERERVQCAIVNLSEGDEARLRYSLGVAKQDYRDVLYWSDHPEAAKIDTPEKKRKMREMLARLGPKPPAALDGA